jgi:hypothetical protein
MAVYGGSLSILTLYVASTVAAATVAMVRESK